MLWATAAALAACAFRSAFVEPQCTCSANAACGEAFAFAPGAATEVRVALANQTLVVRGGDAGAACPSVRVDVDGQDAVEDLGYYGGDCWLAVDAAANTTVVVSVRATAAGTATLFVSPGLLPVPPLPPSGRSGGVTMSTIVYVVTPLNVSANAVCATAGPSLALAAVTAGTFRNVTSPSTPFASGLKAYAESTWVASKVFANVNDPNSAGVFSRAPAEAAPPGIAGLPDAAVSAPRDVLLFELKNSGDAPGDLLAAVSRLVFALKDQGLLVWFASEPLDVTVDDPSARWWWVSVGGFFLTLVAVAASLFPLLGPCLSWTNRALGRQRPPDPVTVITPRTRPPLPPTPQTDAAWAFTGVPFLKFRRV